MGCSDVIFSALRGWLTNGREALPEWKPGLSSCLSLSFSHDQLQQGHCTLLAWCWQQKSFVSLWPGQNCWLINASWSQVPARRGDRGGMAGAVSRGILAGTVSRRIPGAAVRPRLWGGQCLGRGRGSCLKTGHSKSVKLVL